ncbi:MAG: hypothetical protein AAFU79_16090 [Myxococcota bacterium]
MKLRTALVSRRRPRRGFALLIVMLLVALIGIGAAALLDLVNIDIGITSEYRKGIEAESASIGAVLESMSVNDFKARLPQLDTPNLRTRLMTRSGGAYQYDPDGVVATRAIAPADSAHIDQVGTWAEDGYESDVRLLKIVAKENTSFDRPVAVYEVRARASVSGGDASREARSLIYVPIDRRVTRQSHAR